MSAPPGTYSDESQLEVIATSVADGVAAALSGADRLEVVSAVEVDGLLPDLEVVRRLRDAVAIPLRVMLRNAPGFTVNRQAFAVLVGEAERLRDSGVDQFVFGFLMTDGHLDQPALMELCAAVAPRAWTLHRSESAY